MVQSEIVNRVFCIHSSGLSGTCFTMEQDGTQYLITAKHLFEKIGYPDHAVIQILLTGKVFQDIEVDIRYHSQNYDVAVMKTSPYRTISQFFGNNYSTAGMIIGQDAFFLGFPYDYDNVLKNLPGLDRPIPFVKKVCVSGLGPNKVLFLDGHNNPGFSGGPVCFKKMPPQTEAMSIAGVISSYRFSQEPVYDLKGNDTGFYVKSNTGIIYAYDISVAIEIIKTSSF